MQKPAPPHLGALMNPMSPEQPQLSPHSALPTHGPGALFKLRLRTPHPLCRMLWVSLVLEPSSSTCCVCWRDPGGVLVCSWRSFVCSVGTLSGSSFISPGHSAPQGRMEQQARSRGAGLKGWCLVREPSYSLAGWVA